ncbi:MAG TPA: hypothetical protein VI032_04300 [Burkholderiaceae bacterium]
MYSGVRVVTGATLLALGLVACGGGGGDSTPAPGPTAEGVYGGTLSGSTTGAFQLMVLENGEYWALYGTQSSSAFHVAGFLQGTGNSNSGSFTSSDTKDFGDLPAAAGSTSATYNAAAKTISGTVSTGAGSTSFAGGPVAGSAYNYDAPASLGTIAGNWTVTDLLGETIAISIAANGTFTAATNSGCNFSGTISPRASGKNVFDTALTFGSAPCALPGQPARGVAIAYPLSASVTQLAVAVINTSRTVGTAAAGTR